MRICQSCGTDISHRHVTTKHCHTCAYVNHRKKVDENNQRKNPARRPVKVLGIWTAALTTPGGGTMSKMGKPDRRKLIKSLDTEVSRIVRARDRFCVQCGTSERLTCGHLITRGKYSVRWDIGDGDSPGNCFCQCQGCNMKHEYQPEHFTLWFIQEYGRDEYEKLVARSNKLKKWTNTELTELLNRLKEGHE